jgi:hypothetical protein
MEDRSMTKEQQLLALELLTEAREELMYYDASAAHDLAKEIIEFLSFVIKDLP